MSQWPKEMSGSVGVNCYNIVGKCDELFRQKKISGNIYRNQSAVLHHLASEFKLPIQNGVPVVSDEFLANSNLSRVNFKDQWASHPTTEDRECHLKSLNVPAEIRTESAWILFENKDVLETEFTDKIYEHLKKEEGLETVTDLYFENKLKDDANDK